MSNVLLDVLGNVSGTKFAGITYTAKGTGEKARYVVLLGASYENLTAKNLAKLVEKFPAIAAIVGSATDTKNFTFETVQETAAAELIASCNKSLHCIETGEKNDTYTKSEVYEEIAKGIKKSKNDDSLELSGIVISKVVEIPGIYKTVKSSEKTLAKREIEKSFEKSKFRTFKLGKDNFHALRFGKVEIEVK
jgi:hypothetical protein